MKYLLKMINVFDCAKKIFFVRDLFNLSVNNAKLQYQVLVPKVAHTGIVKSSPSCHVIHFHYLYWWYL
jgi:hypothetical protein